MRTVVVLGAGASADCVGASSSSNPDWRPPLAKELFDISTRPAFESILNLYRGAQFLAADLAETARRGQVGLESRLQEYANHKHEVIRRGACQQI